MTIRKRIITFAALVIIGVLVGGCTFPVTLSPDFTIRFDAGTGNGSIFPLGEVLQLSANGSSTAGAVSRALFFADGSLIGESRNTLGGDNFDVRIDWTPTETGEVTLQAAVQRPGGYGYSETVTVCVLPFERGPGLHHEIALAHYEGDCVIPDRSPSGTPGTISMSASATPSSLAYVPIDVDSAGSCASTSLVTFEASVSDPPDDIVLVTVTFEIDPSYGSYINSEYTLILNHTGDELPNTKIFALTYDAYIHLARSLQNHSTGISESGEMTWTARAFGRDGHELAEQGPYIIPIHPVLCDGSVYLPAAAAPSPESTSTPATALDCPSGTYFAPVTQRCIAIEISTPKPAGGTGCSDYGNASACTSNGCGWDKVTASCH